MAGAPPEQAHGGLSRRQAGYYVPGTPEPAGYTLRKPPRQKDYELREPFEYVHRDGESYVVPRSECLRTDLASIPPFASWLVPKDGSHTQPALLHDAMIVKRGETPDYEGPDVDDELADELFREGMRISGVLFFRRWIIWTAVAIRTFWIHGRTWSKLRLALSMTIFALFSLFALPDVLNLPQIFRFRVILWLVGVLLALGAAALAGWHVRRRGLAMAVAVSVGVSIVGIAAIATVIPDHLPQWVPSLLPDVDAGTGWRWDGWSWDRPTNNDAWYFQLTAYLLLLVVGACVNAALLMPRHLFGFLLALLLGLLAYPLSFVLVATAYYWLAEGAALAAKCVRECHRADATRPPVQTGQGI